ncbi:unnamed protein product [Porites evermanni]|uniref:Transposase Helix-turn-helix domain-containing protein n=1 Tax=Porites evermanni TaxID=104178 RepID=A0ABN8SIH8_9CNID|nr:unnamed protein product [Porites evermanni]
MLKSVGIQTPDFFGLCDQYTQTEPGLFDGEAWFFNTEEEPGSENESIENVSPHKALSYIPSKSDESVDDDEEEVSMAAPSNELEIEYLWLSGDGRCDSPGHSAKYGTYTMIDQLSDFQIVQCFKESEKDMIYTGLTFGQFVALLNFLNAYGICDHLNYLGSDYAKVQLPDIEKKGQKRFLEPDDELFLTLCRLRVNMPEKVLADNYNISVSEVSRIFATWLDLLFSRLIQLPVWATRRTVEETKPEVFQQKYQHTRVVLDCTELFIEKPSCFRAQSETYSSYKSHNTAKGLVAIATPCVRFVWRSL